MAPHRSRRQIGLGCLSRNLGRVGHSSVYKIGGFNELADMGLETGKAYRHRRQLGRSHLTPSSALNSPEHTAHHDFRAQL